MKNTYTRIWRVLMRITALALAVSGCVLAPRVLALDGGLGRSISGAQIVPYQAVVPPEPGMFFASVGAIYYPGAIGGAKTFPQGGKLITNIDADITFVPLTVAYDWPVTKLPWNFLSAIVVSYVDETLEADVSLDQLSPRRVSDSASGLFDMMFRVIQASYHFSQTEHMSIAFDVWAPTGDYDPNALANLSLDNWTYVTTLSYTKLLAEEVEFSGLWAIEYYSPNRHTDYQSGVLSRVEALVIKRFPAGLGVGVVGSWFQQLNGDSGPVADLFNGFKGRSYGIGAIVTWSGKAGKMPLNVSARWVHEFQNKNLLEGDVFSLSVGTQF